MKPRITALLLTMALLGGVLISACRGEVRPPDLMDGRLRLINWGNYASIYAPASREYLDLGSIKIVDHAGMKVRVANMIVVEFVAIKDGEFVHASQAEVSKVRVNPIAVLCGHPDVGYAMHHMNDGGVMEDGVFKRHAYTPIFDMPRTAGEFASTKIGERGPRPFATARNVFSVCEASGVATPRALRAAHLDRPIKRKVFRERDAS